MNKFTNGGVHNFAVHNSALPTPHVDNVTFLAFFLTRTALSNCCNIGENQKLPASIFTGFVPLIAHGLRKELLVKPIILGSSFYYHLFHCKRPQVRVHLVLV